jgi:hypothetical protein
VGDRERGLKCYHKRKLEMEADCGTMVTNVQTDMHDEILGSFRKVKHDCCWSDDKSVDLADNGEVR